MARNYRLEIPLSLEELNKIKGKALEYGMTASGFARLVLLNSTIKEVEVDLNHNKRKK